MKKANKIGWVTFWLGVVSALGGLAALEFGGYRQASEWSVKFDVATGFMIAGLAVMAASIAIDLMIYPIMKIGDDDTMSEWGITSQVINGEEIFQVYRLRNVNGIDHSGNREYCGGLFSDETAAQEYADKLNREGAQ